MLLAKVLDKKPDPNTRSVTVIRKLILSALLAAGAVAGVTMTPAAVEAAPPVGHDWDRDDARRAVWLLER